VLAAYSTVHQSKVAVKLLPPIDVKCSLVRNAALGGEWMIDLPAEVCSSSSGSSSVDQLHAGRRPLCPIHYVDPLLNEIKIKNKSINC